MIVAVYVTNGKNNMFIITGLDTIKNSLTADEQNKLKTLLLSINKNIHVRVIIADAVSKIKTLKPLSFA